MRLTTTALAASVLLAPVASAVDFPRLGIFRKKKEDSPAQQQQQQQPQRVKQLAETLRGDLDEAKRKAAAAELAGLDPRKDPEVLSALTGAITRDPSPAVRAAVAEALGTLKPVSQQAGVALEQTVGGDPSEDVRKAARQALWQYHLSGYRSAGANPAYPQTAEPPLARSKPPAKPPVPTTVRPITTGIGKGAIYAQTAEPPLAKPKEKAVPSLPVPPLPTDEGKPPAVPTFAPPPASPVVTVPTVPSFAPLVVPTPPTPGGFAPPPMK